MVEIHHVESLIERSNSSLNSIEHCLKSGIHSSQCSHRLASQILIIIRGMQNPNDLDQAELTVFTQRIAAYFMAWFNTHYQYRGGLLDLEFWQTCERDIAGVMQYPGYQYCWLQLKSTFTDDFIATVDAIAASGSENAPSFYPGLASS